MEECFSVTQVNVLARKVLEEYSVWVKGEVSNASAEKYYYKYFSLKDENASIRCVFPTQKLARLGFKIEDGMSIKVYGTLSVYERDGAYQLKVAQIEKDGAGDLQAKIEAIKQRLQQAGLLNEARKKKLPQLPKRIAVITSKDGAAWKDFSKILTARYPNLEVLLYDVLVQGDKAAKNIIHALTYINTLPDIDLIVITRGGGSLEDLMAFNDEQLAYAIANSTYPVVSAIGHEKDVAISDLVADLRASTPSNAAELIVPDKESIYQGIDMLMEKIYTRIGNMLKIHRLTLSGLIDRSLLKDHKQFLRQFYDQLSLYQAKLSAHSRRYESYAYMLNTLSLKTETLSRQLIEKDKVERYQAYSKIKSSIEKLMSRYQNLVDTYALTASLNNPLQILKKGYSIVSDAHGHIIASINQVQQGDQIQTQLKDGMIQSDISNIIHHE